MYIFFLNKVFYFLRNKYDCLLVRKYFYMLFMFLILINCLLILEIYFLVIYKYFYIIKSFRF